MLIGVSLRWSFSSPIAAAGISCLAENLGPIIIGNFKLAYCSDEEMSLMKSTTPIYKVVPEVYVHL